MLDSAREQQLAHDVFEAGQVRSRYPQYRINDDEVAVFDHAAGLLRPESAVQCAWTAARRNGARLFPYQPVRSVAQRGANWGVRTESGDVYVDHVVLAPGPWAPLLEPLHHLYR